MRNLQSVQTRRLIFHFQFHFKNQFLRRYKQFWTTKCLDKCQDAFVCVYEQNYALVIVTQPETRNLPSINTGRLSFYLSFIFTKPFLSGSKQFWKSNCLDKYQGAFVCVYDQNYALVILIQPKKVGMSNMFRQEELAFIYHSILQNHF